MTPSANSQPPTPPPTQVHVQQKKPAWLPWVLAALALLAVVYGVSRYRRQTGPVTEQQTAVAPSGEMTAPGTVIVAPTSTPGPAAAPNAP